MGTRHTYTSTCELCGTEEQRTGIIYGQYEGDEWEDATHLPDNCVACNHLKKNKPKKYKRKLKEFITLQTALEKQRVEFEKVLEDHVPKYMVDSYLNKGLKTATPVMERYERLTSCTKSKGKNKKDLEWTLEKLASELRKEFADIIRKDWIEDTIW